jgi:hypothetical protein
MPRWKAIDKICDYFHVTRDYFFPPDQKEKPTSEEMDVDDILKMMLNLPREKKEELLVKFVQLMKDGE